MHVRVGDPVIENLDIAEYGQRPYFRAFKFWNPSLTYNPLIAKPWFYD